MHRPPNSDPFPVRSCPVCSGLERRLLYPQRFRKIAEVGFLDGYDVVVCADCGLGFADRLPDQGAFDDYYRDLSKHDYAHRDGRESQHDTAVFSQVADLLQEHIPSRDARIVDIGCATGGLLAVLRQRGFQNVEGIDPAPGAAEAAWRLNQIQVKTCPLSQLSLAGKACFDVAILTGVLEHIRDVDGALTQIAGLLSPNGRIQIAVPNAIEFSRWPNVPFQHFSLEHINFFSPDSLSNLLRMKGFRTVAASTFERVQGFRTSEPIVCGTYARDDTLERTWTVDRATEPALRDYIALSTAQGDREQRILAELAESKAPIIVWGVGTYTQRLLASSQLQNAAIRAFVDSNPKYQGHQLQGVPIIAPHELAGRDEPILISTRMYQDEILNQIRDQLKLPNDVILLHGDD